MQKKAEVERPRPRLGVRLYRWFEMSLLTLLLLLVLAYVLLQSAWVQNALMQKVTAYLSTELSTEVKLERIDLTLFDAVTLEGLLVRDRQADTLVYVDRAALGLQGSIVTLLWGSLSVDEVLLRGVRVHLERRVGEEAHNGQFILDYFKKPKTSKSDKKSDFLLTIKNARLKDIRLRSLDEVLGQDIQLALHRLELRINEYDQKDKYLDVAYLLSSGLDLSYSELERHPLPKKDVNALPAHHKAESAVQADTVPFRYSIKELALENNHLWYHNLRRSAQADPARVTVDFDHLDLDRLQVFVQNITGDSHTGMRGVLKEISATEYSGFRLDRLSADTLSIKPTGIYLQGMRLRTPNTDLGSAFSMEFDDFDAFKNFSDDVTLGLTLDADHHVGVRDIQYFSPSLVRNSFFLRNQQKVVHLEGKIKGTVNRLHGESLKIKLDDQTRMEGEFTLLNAAEGASEMTLLTEFDYLNTSISSLRNTIPGFNPPNNFDHLGNINFSGKYAFIFGTDHIAEGKLETDIGLANLDMKLDMKGGVDAAQYSGSLQMQGFDLGTWTGNKDLERTDFSISIAEGSRGLKLETLHMALNGDIHKLRFKGYDYERVKVNGLFADKTFDGTVKIDERELALNFGGLLNLKEAVPKYDFKLDVERCDLHKLGLSKVPFLLKGSVSKFIMEGNDLRTMRGEALLNHIVYKYQDEKEQVIDSISLVKQDKQEGQGSYLILRSPVATLLMDGKFDLSTVHKTALYVFNENFPVVAKKMGLPQVESSVRFDQFSFNLSVHDSKDLMKVVAPGLDTLRNISATGRISGPAASIDLDIDLPRIRYAGITFDKSFLTLNTLAAAGNYELSINNTKFSKTTELAPIRLAGNITHDKLNFELYNQTRNSVLKQVELKGALSALDSVWQISFDPSNIALFNDQWELSSQNYIRFGKGFFETNQFELSSGDRRIILNSEGKQGLALALTNFDLNFLDNILKDRDIRYSGRIYDFDARIQNIFKMEGIEVFLNTDTLFIRDSPYGFITGNFEMASLKDPLLWKVNLVGNQHRMRTVGVFMPANGRVRNLSDFGMVQPQTFKTQIEAENFPFDVLGQFIPGISRLSGNFNTNTFIGGPFNKIGMNGYVDINQGAFQIDYLKSMFHISKQRITLTDDRIWADGDTIYDASKEQYALVSGGLRHQYFKNWRIDCGIKSVGDRFMILNTTEADNPDYYGQGIGRVQARFTGDFVRTNIDLNAVAMRDSRLYLPIDSYEDAGDVSFIKFVNSSDKKDSTKVRGVNVDVLKGVQFDLHLGITPDAVVRMILDKRAGDNVTGRGVGDITLKYDRTGQFTMYGEYQIESGEYLFTLLNFFNKPFKVAKGGTITWYGDPYQAQVNLTATYQETTPIAALIQNELVAQPDNSTLASQARQPTQVNLNMKLTGDLFKPDITFDIVFPNLTGELKSLVDNKLRAMRQDPNELNRQVFGIVVVGSFLPESSGFVGNSDYFATAFNSVTQVLSGQLSNYLSSIAGEWLGGRVSSIDVNVAYNDIRNESFAGGSINTGREVQLQFNLGLFDNRLRVRGGTQVGYNTIGGTANNFVGGDVQIEWAITENRQWNLKINNRNEPTTIGTARQNRVGAGISFSRDYDSFGHMMQGITDYFKKLR